MASILLIDDDPNLRDILSEWLEYLGHEVRVACNGREGVESYRSAPTELVLTDVFMPEEDGLDAIRHLLEIDPGARIVAMSGGGVCFDADISLGQARSLGAQAVLTKPFRTADLESAIDQVLARA